MRPEREPELRIVRRRTVDLDPDLARLVRPILAPDAAPAEEARRRIRFWPWRVAAALLLAALVAMLGKAVAGT